MLQTKGTKMVIATALVALFALAGCASTDQGEYPKVEIDGAKSARSGADAADAQKWAAAEYASAEAKLAEAERLATESSLEAVPPQPWWEMTYPVYYYKSSTNYDAARLAALDAERQFQLAREKALAAAAAAAVPVPAPVVFSVTDLCTGKKLDGDVVIGGKTVKVKNGVAKAKVLPGDTSFRARAKGHESKTLKARIRAGKTNNVKFALYPSIKKTGKILFASGSDKLLAKSHGILDNIANQIKGLCQLDKVIIEGHTDSDGGADFNKTLSEKRAASVKTYLVGKGISAAKISVVGFGESQPIASNDTKEGKAANRRVEFRLQ